METAALVVSDQTVLQRLAGSELHLRIERRAHRKAALIEDLFAVLVNQLAAHGFGEKSEAKSEGPVVRAVTPSGCFLASSPSGWLT